MELSLSCVVCCVCPYVLGACAYSTILRLLCAHTQASKLQLGDNKSVTCFSDNMCVVHANFSPLVLTFVCEPDVNTALLLATLPELGNTLAPIQQAVLEELSVEG
jgi:hypothetical protein